jgi:hypothetical protein
MPNKKVKLNDIEICNQWLINKNINPETSRKIKAYKKII